MTNTIITHQMSEKHMNTLRKKALLARTLTRILAKLEDETYKLELERYEASSVYIYKMCVVLFGKDYDSVPYQIKSTLKHAWDTLPTDLSEKWCAEYMDPSDEIIKTSRIHFTKMFIQPLGSSFHCRC